MPDPIVVEIPGIGAVEFPAGYTAPQIEQAAAKMHADATRRQQTPSVPARGVLGHTVDAVKEFGSKMNPITAVRSVNEALGDPAGTIRNIGQAQGQLATDAATAWQAGDPLTAARKAVNWLLPMIGPAIDEQSDAAARGDIGTSIGGSVALGAQLFGPKALKSAATTPGAASATERLAAAAEKRSTDKLAGVMAPRVGQNKVRLGNTAAKIAPKIAREEGMGAATRGGLHAKVETKLAEATGALDEAANARLSARTFETKPIIDGLLERRRLLTAETVEGSQFPHTTTRSSVTAAQERAGFGPAEMRSSGPIGESVVPGPNAAQVAAIDQAIAEIRQLGPVARYESIRRIREAYDGPAQTRYNPSVTADYLKQKGGASGAADVTGVLREHLAKLDPETATANAQYSLYKNAADVLRAAEETERVRPSMFRKTMGSVTGAAVGGATGGGIGAVAGVLTAQFLDAVAQSGLTTRIATARMLARLADALRTGRAQVAADLLGQLKKQAASNTLRVERAMPSMGGAAPVPAAADEDARSQRPSSRRP